MELSLRGFIYHKNAESFSDCFDRYNINPNTNKFAVSDGVSKSFFPGIWAELLVDFFVKNQQRINISNIELYKSIQSTWNKTVEGIVNKPDQKYYVKNFFHEGRAAAATFVGLHFFEENNYLKWEAYALGDSYLFFIPSFIDNINSEFKSVIHLSSKKNFEFNNFPDFFDSRNINAKGKIAHKHNFLFPGTFLLMTDALSEWFISQKQLAFEEIKKWKTQTDFENSIKELRKTVLIDDDSAILIITVVNDGEKTLVYKDINVTDIKSLMPLSNTIIDTRKDFNNHQNILDVSENSPDRADREFMRLNDSNESNSTDNNPHRSKKKKKFWEKTLFVFHDYWSEILNGNFESFDSYLKAVNKHEKKKKDDDEDLSSITDKF